MSEEARPDTSPAVLRRTGAQALGSPQPASAGAPPRPPGSREEADVLRPRFPPPPGGRRTRLKRLRFLAILAAVLLLGVVSFVFGMFMSVAAELPVSKGGPRAPVPGREQLAPARRPR